jgi:hypothetical protein
LFESTRLAAAEWYPDGQHGGVVSALIATVVEDQPSLTPMEIARVTVEIFRIVPVTTIEAVVEVVREGKKIQTCEVRLFDGDTEVARGLVQRLRTTELALPASFDSSVRVPPGPDGLADVTFAELVPFPDHGLVTFSRGSVTAREAKGSFRVPGPATVWFKIDTPLIAGSALSATQRAVLAADFSNGLSRFADSTEWVFMNSDLSIHLARPAQGEWVALDGESIWHRGGRGVATSHLFDEIGPIGRATQTLFLDEASSP